MSNQLALPDVPNLDAAIALANRNPIPGGANGDSEQGMRAFPEQRRPTYNKPCP
jgi:hypothetical protein